MLSLSDDLPGNIAVELPGMVADQPAHGEMAYRHVLQHWPLLAKRAGTMFGAQGWLLPDAASSFSNPDDAVRLRADQLRLAGPTGASPAARVAAAIEMLLNHTHLSVQDADVVERALAQFRARPALGFSDGLALEIARKAGHLPLGTFDRGLSRIEGAARV